MTHPVTNAYLGVVIDSIVQEGRLAQAISTLADDMKRNNDEAARVKSLRDFPVLVQDIAHQLRVLDNDNDEETRRERMRLINELVEAADRIVKEGK